MPSKKIDHQIGDLANRAGEAVQQLLPPGFAFWVAVIDMDGVSDATVGLGPDDQVEVKSGFAGTLPPELLPEFLRTAAHQADAHMEQLSARGWVGDLSKMRGKS